MSRIYIILLGSVGFLISAVGGFFSVVGLTHLFSGAPFSVGLMAASLEAAKLVVAGFLYRYWGHIGRVMRYYLAFAVMMLSFITSLGVFGFLSHAYLKSSMGVKSKQMKIAQLKAQDKLIQDQIRGTESFIKSIPQNRISKKFELYEESRDQTRKNTERSLAIRNEISKLQLESYVDQADIGPLMDVAESTGIPVDTLAKTLILIFVSVFDPLAICIVFAWGLAVRLREKYRGDEAKISHLSFTKPVDHRFKKSA